MKQLTILLLSILPKLLFGQYQELDSLDAFIAKQVTDYRMPGLAIGIIKNNKVIFKKGYGITSTNWDNLTSYFDFPMEIRKIIYTTNTIENVNRGIRKYIKTKVQFTDDMAA